MDALKRLIEAVDADAFDRLDASARYNYFCNMWEDALGVATVSYEKGWAAYRKGDLNAAKALHDTLLPGWRLETMRSGSDERKAWMVSLERVDGPAAMITDGATCGNPARAWLLAILRAKLADVDNSTAPDETAL